MQKRRILTVIAVLLAILPLASAVPPTGSVIYGESSTIVRSTSFPSENVHITDQQEQIASVGQLDEVRASLNAVQQQVNDIKVVAENQRTEVGAQLGNINRELGAIKANLDNLQSLQQQVGELRPAIEQPQEIIPPTSLTLLSVFNMILLIVVIVLIFWMRGQWKAIAKESHEDEHAQIHLTDFIREAMHKGASMAEIRKRLMQRGWSDAKIEEAVQEVRMMHAA
jgi:hypothetical protein